jgi:uncharacterized damage-inducible protein DinB
MVDDELQESTMLIDDFRAEFKRYRSLGERAMAQMPDAALNVMPTEDGNSVGMIARHISGNFISRFSDFLTTGGEKPTRHRDEEFEIRDYTRLEVDSHWKAGWSVLEEQLGMLTDSDLGATVLIRRQPMTVHAALSRAVSHLSYHVGQIVMLARMHAVGPWQSLSIPRGQSEAFNRTLEVTR